MRNEAISLFYLLHVCCSQNDDAEIWRKVEGKNSKFQKLVSGIAKLVTTNWAKKKKNKERPNMKWPAKWSMDQAHMNKFCMHTSDSLVLCMEDSRNLEKLKNNWREK